MRTKPTDEAAGVRFDVLNPEQRSRCMSRVRSTNTKPERRLRRALWATGLRYRLGHKLPGKPDLVFVSAKLAVFVDGCFWHSCPKHRTHPKTNERFWAGKLQENVERDRRVDRQLRAMGWRVLRLWQHEVEKELDEVVVRVRGMVMGAAML